MLAEAIDVILNLSTLFAILIAPCFLLVAMWYRKSLKKAIFVWAKPEMVLITIVFFVMALILFIVGVSCVFSHFGYLDTQKFSVLAGSQYFNVGIICFMGLAGITSTYFSLRRLLVHAVVESGLVLNRGILPVPSSIQLLAWDEIADYYLVPDYPNASFTFIVQSEHMQFTRISVKVPIYLKEDFQFYLDKQLQAAQSERKSSEISSRRYNPEN
jgi:hypothetical protein